MSASIKAFNSPFFSSAVIVIFDVEMDDGSLNIEACELACIGASEDAGVCKFVPAFSAISLSDGMRRELSKNTVFLRTVMSESTEEPVRNWPTEIMR